MKNSTKFIYFLLMLFVFSLSSCAVVRQDEVGVRRRLGKLGDRTLPAGAYVVNPFFAKILKIPTRTINMPMMLEGLPSKEGLTIQVELSILYRIQGEKAIQILKEVGKVRFGEQIIMSVLRSAAADVTAKFLAKICIQSKERSLKKKLR